MSCSFSVFFCASVCAPSKTVFASLYACACAPSKALFASLGAFAAVSPASSVGFSLATMVTFCAGRYSLTIFSSSTPFIGFERYEAKPFFLYSSLTPSMALAVSAITGVSELIPPPLLIFSKVSIPSICGII